jgi:uncharacterized protein (TIGR02453 family)
MSEPSTFSGFSADALQFLRDLAANNDRAWFQPRKADYERLLKEPLEELCASLGDRFARLDVPLQADPVRSPFRIYRDVRFSKDKSPYKTYVSASFPWIGEGRGVGGYFSLSPGDAYVGGGMWHPEPARLAAWRSAIADRPRAVHAALRDAAFVATFGEVEGERLKRVPSGFPSDHPDAELIKLKDVTFGRRLTDGEVTSAELPDTLAAALATGMPLMRLLANLAA